jgi:hypothetical protein
MLPITLRTRIIDESDLELIQTTINEHWDKGRTSISRSLCEKWRWFQPNGRLKDMACREILLTLYRKGLIKLPPAKYNPNNSNRNKSVPFVEVDQSPLEGKLSEFAPVMLNLVRHTELEPLYNSLVHHYHYLGYRQIVGAHLKYIAFIDDRPVACLGWGSAAWRVKSRDEFIGWDKPTRERNLRFVVNNTRFLVLPWASLKCLASKVLALAAKRISSDWLSIYHHPIYLLETFVEKDRFQGTCYKASNWTCVGQTMGTSKRGNSHFDHGTIKDVFLYPLRKDARYKLGE